ncbi:hypothetical protein Cgig2_017812 [Carnegiea gigantea]|uniref:DUF4283 domain-containing protein n=1 Tax=Carnegiea gigantea TaxID=171969 RepID=A0A9Q1KV11_9CARY|nr:hypothetical protein Cgig2_017812 [Carnegiea gigantea]
MKTVLKNVWKPSKGVIIRDLNKNLFAFQFFSTADKDFVLNEGPWAFDGNILLLTTIAGFEQPSEVQFTNARLWIKAIDVPPIKQTLTFAKVLGDNLDQFVGCDVSSLFCAADKSVNFQVDVDTSPSPYEEGCLGHVLSACELYKEVDDESNLQYGDWRRGSPIKPMRRNAKAQK